MDLQELNKKFKPSAWNPELTPDQVIEKYFRIAEECKMTNQSSLDHQLNIPYGDDRPGMTFDVYGLNLPSDSPIMIFIHGGYWQMTSKSENTFIVHPLVQAGCRVYLLGYDLCPTVTLEELHDEIEEGLREILKIARENNCKGVLISGHSAGACLAMSMLSRLDKFQNRDLIKSVNLIGGIYDLTEARHTDEVNKGNILSVTDSNLAKLSPLLQDYSHLAAEEQMKICVIIGEFDAPGLIQQGQMMFAKLTGEGASPDIVTAKSFDHFDLVTNLRDPECFLTKMIIKEVEELNK